MRRIYITNGQIDMIERSLNEGAFNKVVENKVPSAQDQVKGKVNAGIMDGVTSCGMMEEEMLCENQNDKLANDYVKNNIGIEDFQEIRDYIFQICHAIPNVRFNKRYYLLGVIRLIYEEKLRGRHLSELNNILYNIRERNDILDRNLDGLSFMDLWEEYYNTEDSVNNVDSVEKIRKTPTGYIIKHIESYDESYNSGPQDWCITYEEEYYYTVVNAGDCIYIVENPEMMKSIDRKSREFDYACRMMGDPTLYDLGEYGSGEPPYDTFGLSRFVVLVNPNGLYVYSRWNIPDDLDGQFLNREELEEVIGMPFNEAFPYIKPDEVDDEIKQDYCLRESVENKDEDFKIDGVTEESTFSNVFKPIANFMKNEGLNVYPFPDIELNWDDQDGLFIKTGYYLPGEKKVVLFCKDRHPKDILRSYAHEMIHHMQNLNGDDLNFSSEDDVKDNDKLEKLESEAYLKGNIYFRKWTEHVSKNSDDTLNESVLNGYNGIKYGVNINIDNTDWISLILNHEKTIETRPLSAANMWRKHIGETIGLVRTTKSRKDSTGMLVGSATLVDVVDYLDEKSFMADIDKHKVSGQFVPPRCGLVLDNVKEIKPWVKLKSMGQQQVRPIEINDSILNESILRESPDSIENPILGYDDDSAYPFIAIKGFPKDILVGINGSTHWDIVERIEGDAEEGENTYRVSQELLDAVKSREVKLAITSYYEFYGRYWSDDGEGGHIISLWGYDKNDYNKAYSDIVRAVGKMQDEGIEIDFSTLDFDDWRRNFPSFRYPVTWLGNGMAEIYVPRARQIKKENGYYIIFLDNGRALKVDKKGNVVGNAMPSFINENVIYAPKVDESLSPSEVDLSSFNIKKELNPKFWKDDKLDSRIRIKLLDIADDFIEFLGVDWVKPEDITITGSLANYNWNKKYSDIDLHILIDYSKVDKRTDFVDNYFYSQKKLWNEEHRDLRIFGFPVEVYVQDVNKEHTSSGVYSLEKNEWVIEPEREKLSKKKVNKERIKKTVSQYTEKIDKLVDDSKNTDGDEYKMRKVYEGAQKLFDEIKKLRREDLSDANNEINEGNIIFKALRRLGYIDKLDKVINKGYNTLNSLP